MADEREIELVGSGLDRVQDVARFLGLSRSMVYKLMDEAALPYVKFGKSRRIPRRAVLEYAASQIVPR